jgi:DNA (cytosine-5)-methyltransferase 1
MADIAGRPRNGLRLVSTFSGCGGSCLGFKMEGFTVVWANEFIPAAAETYRANHGEVPLDTRDVRTVQPADILAATGLRPGELDVLEGSPPCASFSIAGQRSKGWGTVKHYSDTQQRTDDLFFEYARLLEGLQPKVFVAENVAGLTRGIAKGYFKLIYGRLRECGYRVAARLLDSQWLGVPQNRVRLFFIGVREDLGREPVFPTPLSYNYSLREALPWIRGVTLVNPTSNFNDGPRTRLHGPAHTVTANGVSLENLSHYYVEAETDISRYAIGAEWSNLGPGGHSQRYVNLVRAHSAKPSPTICAEHGRCSLAGVVHPYERRKFSIRELRRICSFPEDFILTGSYRQQWERLGRSVPPVMMSHVARTIRDKILYADSGRMDV